MNDIVLNVARDFSKYPGGRFRRDGPHSGEEMREKLLTKLKELQADRDHLVVELDGAVGYSASFLEEAFGGLVRIVEQDQKGLVSCLEIRAGENVYQPYKRLAERYIEDARNSR